MNLYVLIDEASKLNNSALFLAEDEGAAREMSRLLIGQGFATEARSFAVPLDEAGLVFVGTAR